MNLNHRFWQVLALSLATLALERRWVVAGILIGLLSWAGGLLYALLA